MELPSTKKDLNLTQFGNPVWRDAPINELWNYQVAIYDGTTQLELGPTARASLKNIFTVETEGNKHLDIYLKNE